MSYLTKKPPIRVVLEINAFNELNSILDNISAENNSYSTNALKLSNKLLKYSVPIANDDGETTIDVRFFNNEARDIIVLLLNYAKNNLDIKKDFYNELLENRRELKSNK